MKSIDPTGSAPTCAPGSYTTKHGSKSRAKSRSTASLKKNRSTGARGSGSVTGEPTQITKDNKN